MLKYAQLGGDLLVGRMPKYTPGKDYSRAELIKLIKAQGWTVEPKGKTGHLVCRKNGENPFDIPTNPGKKTKQIILKLIGLK